MAQRTGHDTHPTGPEDPPRRRRRHRVWRYAAIVLGLLVIALVAARLALPWYLESYVNRTIDRSPDFTGYVGTIDVHLWRGAYTIHDLKIKKRSQSIPLPFFEGRKVDFSLDWRSLAHGQVRGKIVMDQPRLNFVQGPSSDESQTGANQPWLGIIDELYPFRIDEAEVKDGEIHFHALHKDPQVDVFLSEVNAKLTNLTNIENKLDPLMAKLEATGTAMHSGQFKLAISLDPKSHLPTFDLALQLVGLDVRRLNALALAYGDFDFEEGSFDFVVELSAKEGYMEGYAKPLFRNIKVISLRDLKTKDPLQSLWEALVGIVGEVFKNQSRDQFGTRLTLEGDISNPNMNILEVIGNVLRNAFVRAYLPRLEGRAAPGVAGHESGSSD